MPFSSTRCRTLLLSGVAAVTFATGLAAQRGGGPPAPLASAVWPGPGARRSRR